MGVVAQASDTDKHNGNTGNAESGPVTSSVFSLAADGPCKQYQLDLLDLGFKAASAIPVDPHVTDRSRAQETVVDACLQLDQPTRALNYVNGIVDFRKGTAYADIAFWFAQHDDRESAQKYMNTAKGLAEKAEEWRQDRIKVKIARTLAWMGAADEATALENGVVEAEGGKVAAVSAERADDDTFDAQIATLDGMIASGSFDPVCNAMEACCKLYDRYYGDEKRRMLLEDKVRAASVHVPAAIRIEYICKLGAAAMKHADKARMAQLSYEGQQVLKGGHWAPDDHMAMVSKLAVLQHGAGQTAEATAALDADKGMYEQEKEKIISVYRSEALRKIAGAYQEIGESAKALETYREALETGASNPNQRPRALDLTGVCVSMAVEGVEPDAALRERMTTICAGLKIQ